MFQGRHDRWLSYEKHTLSRVKRRSITHKVNFGQMGLGFYHGGSDAWMVREIQFMKFYLIQINSGAYNFDINVTKVDVVGHGSVEGKKMV